MVAVPNPPTIVAVPPEVTEITLVLFEDQFTVPVTSLPF